MDSTSNATSFANLQGFFPPYTSALTGGAYSSSQLMSGFAKAASNTQISPLNAKNWATADSTDYVIPDHDQVADERGSVRRHGQQGQHPAAERPQHRQRELAGLVSRW